MSKARMRGGDYLALLAVALLTLIGILAETALNVTYPELAQVFQISLDITQWLTAGYLLMVTIMMGTTAYLLKRFPAKRLQLVAALLFIVGDVGSALAMNFPVLMVSRLLQAMATGLSTPMFFHLIFTLVPREKLGAMTGVAGMVISFAPALGPTYGGWLATVWSWRAIFWFVLPVALISLWLGQRFITATPAKQPAHFNLASFLALALAMFTWIYALSMIGRFGFTGLFYWLLVLALALYGFFIYLNFRGATPLVDLRIFQHLAVSLDGLTYFCLQFINIGLSLVIPIYAQYTLHASAFISGAILLPGTLVGAVMSPLAGALADRVGFAVPVIGGSCLLTLGAAGFFFGQAQLTVLKMTLLFVVLRAGFNMAFANTISNASTHVALQNTADVSSLFNMLQQLAGATGVVFLASLMALFENQGTGTMAMRTYAGGRIDFGLTFSLALIVFGTALVNYHFQAHRSAQTE
ncbi:MFS transporter [Limosilactobacillus ingluviei]|uniref:MFS transporter n=1 Tax=Limosilactobacillus ingluviei TaxID=148604 RepID=UPI0023F2403D|nr:MFS transporter [Limosilactobacillus ingluviei]MDO4604135.1 MFS transporter [Limosilactobacillus ingluviei]